MNRMKHMVVVISPFLAMVVGLLSPTLFAAYVDAHHMIQQENISFRTIKLSDKASSGTVEKMQLIQEISNPVQLTFDTSISKEKAENALHELDELFTLMQISIDLSEAEVDAQTLYYYMDRKNQEIGFMAWYIEIIDPSTDLNVEVILDDSEEKILSLLVNDMRGFYHLSITEESFEEMISCYFKYIGIEDYDIVKDENNVFVYKENNSQNEQSSSQEYRIKIYKQNNSCEISANFDKYGFALNRKN